jgi:hypothetical protein
VFVDVLAELAAHQHAIVAATQAPLLFAEQRLYVLALASFVVLYDRRGRFWPFCLAATAFAAVLMLAG